MKKEIYEVIYTEKINLTLDEFEILRLMDNVMILEPLKKSHKNIMDNFNPFRMAAFKSVQAKELIKLVKMEGKNPFFYMTRKGDYVWQWIKFQEAMKRKHASKKYSVETLEKE